MIMYVLSLGLGTIAGLKLKIGGLFAGFLLVFAALISFILITALLVGHILQPGNYLFTVLVILEQVEAVQIIYGLLVGALLGRGFKVVASQQKTLDRTIAITVAALVLAGFFLPLVVSRAVSIKEVSLPFGSVAFFQQNDSEAGGPTAVRDAENPQFRSQTTERAATALFRGLANVESGKGNINRDYDYIKLSNPKMITDELEIRLKRINSFVAEVLQPIGACIERVRSDTGGTYLIDSYIGKMVGSLRHIIQNPDADWQDFQKTYLAAQIDLIKRIHGQHILSEPSSQNGLLVSVSPLAACTFVIPILRHRSNPFKQPAGEAPWPYGAMSLAVLLHAAGKTEAALVELARWLDMVSGLTKANGLPEWMKVRAKIYLFELMKGSARNGFSFDLALQILHDFNSLFGLPATAKELKDLVDDGCSTFKSNKKNILFSYLTYVNDALSVALESKKFALEWTVQQTALNWADYLNEFESSCFRDAIREEVLDEYGSRFQRSIGRTYLSIARTNELKDRRGDLSDDQLLLKARAAFLKAGPAFKELADKERENAKDPNRPYQSQLNSSEYWQKSYDSLANEILLLSRKSVKRAP